MNLKSASSTFVSMLLASIVSAASGPITSGENRPGTITSGSSDTWTFTLSVNDTVLARVGEVSGGNGFSPHLRLLGPDSALITQHSGTADAEVTHRATVAGTYTLSVSGYYANDAGSYLLRMLRLPATTSIPDDDDGGPLSTGLNHDGVIDVGDLDPFTINASANDSLLFRVGELSGGNSFSPRLRLYGPDGALTAQDSGTSDAEVYLRTTLAGTYTLVVSGYYAGDQGSYLLRAVRSPGALNYAADEGEDIALGNGLNHDGTIGVGDLDAWTIGLATNETVLLRVGEISGGNGFSPRIRLFAPDGTLIDSKSGTSDAELTHRATFAGNHTVVVSGYYAGDAGSYQLRVFKSGGTPLTPADDQGGVLTNGMVHEGTLGVGDVDSWAVTLGVNESVLARIGEISGGNGFSPVLRLFGPDGEMIVQQSGTADAELYHRATFAGNYTLMASGYYAGDQGTYRLQFLKMPGGAMVPSQDQGGVLVVGSNQEGTLNVGDFDAWSFAADANSTAVIRMSEISGGNALSPRLRLYGPDGALVAEHSGNNAAEISQALATTGVYTVVAAGYYAGNAGTYQISLSGVTSTTPPTIAAHPPARTVTPSDSTQLSITTGGSGTKTHQWWRGSTMLPGATQSSLALTSVQPDDAGLYWVTVTGTGQSLRSLPAVVGLSSSEKLVGTGTEYPDILHPVTQFTYDQILLQANAATITADAGQITRISFIDLNDDIVQVEFSGPGALTLILDNVSGPATPVNYVQNVAYMKGHASIIVTGATENTHLSVFSVGTLVNANPALYRANVDYDGLADLAYIAISSANGKFGGLRTANASYFADRGLTGVYAPGVQFTGPVFVGNINAFDTATAVLVIGSGTDTRVTGGNLHQSNGLPVQVKGLTQLRFTPGTTSHGLALAAQTNRARLEADGVDVTATIAVNP